MAPKEGNSIVKHGVLDERLNVHGVQGLKVADLSICPDNVGCNTYSVRFTNAHSYIQKKRRANICLLRRPFLLVKSARCLSQKTWDILAALSK